VTDECVILTLRKIFLSSRVTMSGVAFALSGDEDTR
jgi:hypothetical protein